MSKDPTNVRRIWKYTRRENVLPKDIFTIQEDRFCCYFRGIFQFKITHQDNNKFSYSYLDRRRLKQRIRIFKWKKTQEASHPN